MIASTISNTYYTYKGHCILMLATNFGCSAENIRSYETSRIYAILCGVIILIIPVTSNRLLSEAVALLISMITFGCNISKKTCEKQLRQHSHSFYWQSISFSRQQVRWPFIHTVLSAVSRSFSKSCDCIDAQNSIAWYYLLADGLYLIVTFGKYLGNPHVKNVLRNCYWASSSGL